MIVFIRKGEKNNRNILRSNACVVSLGNEFIELTYGESPSQFAMTKRFDWGFNGQTSVAWLQVSVREGNMRAPRI